MMLLVISFYTLGWVLSHCIAYRLGPVVVTSFATPLGWLVFGTIALVGYWAHVPGAVMTWSALAVVTAAIVWWKTRPPFTLRFDGCAALVGLFTTVMVAGVASIADFHFFSEDGVTMTLAGQHLFQKGFIEYPLSVGFLDFGALPIVWQSFAPAVHAEYVYVLAPLFSVSVLVALWVLSRCIFSTYPVAHRLMVLVPVLGVLISTPLFWVHSETVHGILPSLLFLLWFWTGVLMHSSNRETAWMTIAFAALAGFTLCRPESPLYTALFLGIWFSDDKISLSHFKKCLTAYSIAVFAYYGLLAAHDVERNDPILSAERIALVLFPLAAICLFVFLASRYPRRIAALRRSLGSLEVGILSLAYALLFVLSPAHLSDSFFRYSLNLVQVGGWEFTAVGLVVVSLWLATGKPGMPGEKMLLQGIAGFFLIVHSMSAFRAPFRPSYWDTGNRMTLLLLPLILLVVAGRVLKSSEHAAQAVSGSRPTGNFSSSALFGTGSKSGNEPTA